MRYLVLFISFLCFSMLFVSCLKAPQYPAVPEIKFNKIYRVNNPTGTEFIVIRIDFKDGDGDIGVNTEETNFAPYIQVDSSTGVKIYNKFHNNYWVDMFVKQNGKYQPLKFSTDDAVINFFGFDGKVPIVSESSLNKKSAIEGYIDRVIPFSEVVTDLRSTTPNLRANNDTLKFKIRLVDRKFNVSDTIETDPVVLFPR